MLSIASHSVTTRSISFKNIQPQFGANNNTEEEARKEAARLKGIGTGGLVVSTLIAIGSFNDMIQNEVRLGSLSALGLSFFVAWLASHNWAKGQELEKQSKSR